MILDHLLHFYISQHTFYSQNLIVHAECYFMELFKIFIPYQNCILWFLMLNWMTTNEILLSVFVRKLIQYVVTNRRSRSSMFHTISKRYIKEATYHFNQMARVTQCHCYHNFIMTTKVFRIWQSNAAYCIFSTWKLKFVRIIKQNISWAFAINRQNCYRVQE